MESIDWQTWKFLLEKHLRNEKIYTFVATVVATLPVLNSVLGRLFCFYTMKYNKIYFAKVWQGFAGWWDLLLIPLSLLGSKLDTAFRW